ncbi:sensor histidine kinase [Rhizomonospora bruguierae]|uniref:sensor histidine kinase n=1 Tax=Rhizomonospora bruguierae TaxID=1581705 RepID=UPI001BCDF61E|nr:HAMP domain-containing sensor histidine kinase [Micromonospora sp. NBRC 107566]
MKPFSLRTRVTAGFTAGALALSAGMAVTSYELIRRSLLSERERGAVRSAYYNATIVNGGLVGAEPDVVDVLRSLDTGTERRPVLRRDDAWFSRNADAGVTEAIPAPLQARVAAGLPTMQRIRVDGAPALVVGVPLAGGAAFYQIDSLRELDRTFQIVALALTAVAVILAGAGALLGSSISRYILRPVAGVASAARDIASGNLGARLDPATEPDLAVLSVSFNDMVDRLAQQLERDRRFAADVAHELRSPLQTLAAAGSVVAARRGDLDARTATALDLLTAEIARFQTLVNDLLELARADQPARREHVDVAELARQACRSRRIPDGIVQVEDGLPIIWHVDRRRILQLLGNLLDNAARHGGGATAVRLGRSGDLCYLEVDDEGPGVDPADKTVIFDRFVRGRTSVARAGGDGTGLGLALVAQHAAAHHGTAVATARPGGGARFRVELAGCLS